jgi:hypothetical protein
MGSISYDGTIVRFDDRMLAHLHIVIMQQFRRNESFAMSWLDDLAVGDGRSSVWLHPACLLYFKFSGSRPPTLSEDWLKALTASARSSRGLIVTNEDGTPCRSLGANSRQ